MEPEKFARLIEQVQVMRLLPNDTIVFRSPGPIEAETGEHIKKYLQNIFGPDRRIVVLGEGCELQIVREQPGDGGGGGGTS